MHAIREAQAVRHEEVLAMTQGRSLTALGAALVALALGACSLGADTKTAAPVESQRLTPSAEVAPEAAPAAVAAAAAPPAQTTLASEEYNQDPDLLCDILEVKRLSGGAMLVKWRLSRPSSRAGSGLTAAPPAAIHHTWSWDYVYVTDPAENKKYFGLKDSAGSWLAQGEAKHYAPGERQVMWMKFPAPPETSARIGFVFQGFPPFEDLAVSR
jgi:hypothetical protein